MDHRIGSTRESTLLGSSEFQEAPDGEKWWKQMRDYFTRRICLPAHSGPSGLCSAYVDSCNGANAVGPKILASFDQLLHVASLNNMLWRLAGAEYHTFDLDYKFHEITGCSLPQRRPGADDRFKADVDAIAAEVMGKPDKVKEMAGLLSDALTQNQPPWWACFAEEAGPYYDAGDWVKLCRVLGLGHFHDGHWVLSWRYEVGLAGTVYRPTVVEANDGPFHFPSPPSEPYGITMPLDLGDVPACCEVVHPPLTGQAAVRACTGLLGHMEGAPCSTGDLHLFRQRHTERLKTNYNKPQNQEWFNRHMGIS
ncbi:hypothetical protein EPN96_12670 [bacterium]|nr:MAG: hypothetical protein EPN96_12670 [bacterium]